MCIVILAVTWHRGRVSDCHGTGGRDGAQWYHFEISKLATKVVASECEHSMFGKLKTKELRCILGPHMADD